MICDNNWFKFRCQKLEGLSLFPNALYFELINSDLAPRKPPFVEGTESKREWKFSVGRLDREL